VLAAASLEGVVAVPLPPDLPATERAGIVDDADPRAMVVDPTVADDPAPTTSVRVHAVTADDLAALPGTDPTADRPRTRPMTYTSGTTGRRKGVHVGVHDPDWGRAIVDAERAAFDARHGTCHLVVSPLYHSGPFRFALVTALLGGGLSVLGGFDVDRFRDALRTLRPSSMFCVPTQLTRWLGHPAATADDLASLDLLAHAGAPCPEGTKRRLLELAPDGSVWEFYGATEGQFTTCPPATWLAAPGTVGHARPGHRLEVRDDDGRPVGTDQVGTVWCHAPEHARFTYWRDPARTVAAWDGDAFTVGDLGSLDAAGRLRLAGRPGDLVITGGVNVYPAEVERHLIDLPGVAEAAVFGVPDPDWGQRVVAAVVPDLDAELAGDELRARLGTRLRRTEVPKAIAIVAALPRTTMGKLDRRELQAMPGPWNTA
jgi:long-chain acyl-CoA synthetase